MQAFHADQFVLPLPEGHRFPMGKYERLRARVVEHLPMLRLGQAQPASDGELALAHTPRYVSAVAEGLLCDAEQREIGYIGGQNGAVLALSAQKESRCNSL